MTTAEHLPEWQCHKKVRAAKIEAISDQYIAATTPPQMCVSLRFADGSAVNVGSAYLTKHKPEVGGYYVLYDGGYESFSPATVFESGYTKI